MCYLVTDEGTNLTVKLFSSWGSVHYVDNIEVWKTPKGLVLIGPSSRVIAVLLKFYLMIWHIQTNSMTIFWPEISPADRSTCE